MANRELARSVVVIVGASSGLGRAAALAFAKRGAQVVLGARNAKALDDVARACEAYGVRALACPVDVADADQIKQLVRSAIDFGGRIDIWINNVGTGAVGGFLETPLEAHERVVDVNLVSHIRGAHAVLPHFIRQGSGVLINTNSVGAWSPSPYAASYAAGKFGLRGFSESLRGELSQWPDVHICEVYPTFMNTPGLRHGANYSGVELKPPPGVYDPHRAAAAMVRLAEKPRPALVLGGMSWIARVAHLAAPYLMARVTARAFESYRAKARSVPRSDGNLFAPSQSWTTVEGGWRSSGQRAAGSLALGALVACGLAALIANRTRHRREHGQTDEHVRSSERAPHSRNSGGKSSHAR